MNRTITFHHANTRGSRMHIFVSRNSCHPRVMSRSLPQLTLTTSTSSLSPTSSIFPTFSPSHPNPLAHDPYLLCEDSRPSGGSTQIPSLSRPRGSEMICLRERQTRFSSNICCKDFGLLVVDISVAFMHTRTDEEIYVKVPSGIKSSRFGRLKAAVNGTRKASKHWQDFSCDKIVTNMLSNRTTSFRVFTNGFVTSRTWNSTATIVVGR